MNDEYDYTTSERGATYEYEEKVGLQLHAPPTRRCESQKLMLSFLSLVLLDQHVSGAEAGGEQAGGDRER